MNQQETNPTSTPQPSLLTGLLGILCVAIPPLVLVGTMVRSGSAPPPILAGGTATLAFLALAVIQQAGPNRACSHKTCSPLYLIAVLIIWMTSRESSDWFINAAMGTLLGIPLFLFICQEFLFTGRASLRRARSLVRRLSNRTKWPATLEECRALPEVKALREALRDDAEPAMVLLMHPKPEVRIAALAALEFRPGWKKGQAETVLKAAKFATEPPVRIAALMALANVDEPGLVSAIAVYLRDATPQVRIAAAEALLWDGDRRWLHIRKELRAALADFRCRDDGPLPCAGPLPEVALNDLTMWAAEASALGIRATLTLRQHYRRELNENPSPELVEELTARIRDGRISSALRVELAQLLVEADVLGPKHWLALLDPGQPSALRLLAAGALLRTEQNEQALETLREVARVPNRAMTLQVASIIQRCLRIDMGLPIGGELPEPQSKEAAEIARLVLEWASGRTPVVQHTSSRRKRVSTIIRQIPRASSEPPRRRT